MPITLALPLDLPDVPVLASRLLEDGTLLMEVDSTLPTARCYRCGREMDRFQCSDRPLRLRHLPVVGRTVWLEIRAKRYAVRLVKGAHPPLSVVPGTTPTVCPPKRSRQGY